MMTPLPTNQETGPTGKVAEYVEKLVSESFKREADQEENVIRSLPFFATSIGVLVAFIGLARPALPPLTLSPFPIIVYGLLTGVMLSLTVLIAFLFLAVRQRTFKYPMSEADLIAYAARLTDYYSAAASPAASAGTAESGEADHAEAASENEADTTETIEKAVIDDLRNTITGQIAEAARVSRANNIKRLGARARAFASLMVALGFALALIVVY
jgi:hypothetical protein